MEIRRQKKCPYCKRSFKVNARLGDRQITCGNKRCRRAHHAKYRRRYRRLNWEEELGYQSKRKQNRPKDYWKNYRIKKVRASKRSRFVTCLRKKLKNEGLQRQLDILEVVETPNRIPMFFKFATSNRSLILKCLG